MAGEHTALEYADLNVKPGQTIRIMFEKSCNRDESRGVCT
jgi:hypothetical protein